MRAIEVSVSPRVTTYVVKGGSGVGVGRTNDGRGVGPVGPGVGVEAGWLTLDAPGPVLPVSGRQPPTAAARRRRRTAGPVRRSIIGGSDG
jgi:hypothetical protein